MKYLKTNNKICFLGLRHFIVTFDGHDVTKTNDDDDDDDDATDLKPLM